jgi:hypothetical protein
MEKVSFLMRAAALAFFGVAATGCSQNGDSQKTAYRTEEPQAAQKSQPAEDEYLAGAEQTEPAPTPSSPAPAAPAASAAASADLVGKAVFDSTGREIGKIAEIIASDSGSEEAVIVVGDFLGMEPRKIATPIATLQSSPDGKGLTIQMTAEEVDAAPAYEKKEEGKTGTEPAEIPNESK